MTGAATGTGSMASPSILGMLRDIAKHEGVRALWKGNAAVVARFAPTKGLDFFTFNLYKGALATMGIGPGGGGDGDGSALSSRAWKSCARAAYATRAGRAGARPAGGDARCHVRRDIPHSAAWDSPAFDAPHVPSRRGRPRLALLR